MATPSSNSPSIAAIQYLINHVFLPPRLPQEDDSKAQHESLLINITIDALSKFKVHVNNDQSDNITSVLQMMIVLKNIHPPHSNIYEAEFLQALGDLPIKGEYLSSINSTQVNCLIGGTIPLYVRAQNAGLLIRKIDKNYHFEAFELSPLNEQVIKTKGRLRRMFPGRVLLVKPEVFEQPDFQATVAHTLSKMGHQAVIGTQPQAKKAGQMLDEDRDTAHPKMVTELFFGFLGAVAEPVDGHPLWKNTREEVLWLDSHRPWRRSPQWLLMRVAMQHTAEAVYKEFMMFFMAYVLEMSHQRPDIDSDLIHIMHAKIIRRLLKLNPTSDCPGLEFVQVVLQRTSNVLRNRWTIIQKQADPTCNLSELPQLDFITDTIMSLPGLDQYLQMRHKRKHQSNSVAFQSGSKLIKCSAKDLPPDVQSSNPDILPYNVKNVESWVESHLDAWVARELDHNTTCQRLAGLIQSYFAAASRLCQGNPETTSIMLLTILEIWIACDKVACHVCNILQHYDPGIPRELFTSLLLPLKSQMLRLLNAEKYLNDRRRIADEKVPDIFKHFGSVDSFSVRYFQQSSEHRELFEKIVRHATEQRQAKCAELAQKKKLYNDLIKKCDLIVDHESREVLVDSYTDINGERHEIKMPTHPSTCQKCAYKTQADRLRIETHEWPLPENNMNAQSVVFELNVPSWFGYWRDATVFFLIDILQSEYSVSQSPRSRYPLHTYSGLSSFFKQFSGMQRIGMLSEDKPSGNTHRREVLVSTSNENAVCVNHGPKFKYHDSTLGCFVDSFCVSDEISKRCTFTLPTRVASLQRFIFRPELLPDGPKPNAVPASQSECPVSMSPAEYTALSTLPLGCRIQWRNIEVELYMPTVDFKKVETTLVILQVIYQAGRLEGNGVLRESHAIVGDTQFATTLLVALEQALQRIKENWESSQALCTFISLATRVLSLTASKNLADKYLLYISSIRCVAFKWAMYLKKKASTATDDKQRAEFRLKAVEIALICLTSFNLEGEYLDRTLSVQEDASLFFQCCFLIQEEDYSISSSSDCMVTLLYHRWKMISFRSYHILSESITQGDDAALNDAVKKTWSAFEAGDHWQKVSRDLDYWLVSHTASNSASGSLTVHFNLLTGKLLVDGLPLARLPSKYEQHSTYRSLFGNSTLDIMPTSAPGMQFSGKEEFSGHTVHFNMVPSQDSAGKTVKDFLVRASRQGQSFELIPSRLLEGEFPSDLVTNFAHWYNVTDNSVEFRPIGDPWTRCLDTCWVLTKSKAGFSSRWRLVKESQDTLLSIKSATARTLSKILAPLEDPTQIHIVLNLGLSPLMINIELPRFQLGFRLQSQTSDIQSKQFRGMIIDTDQSLGTLVGLSNKLVLTQRKRDRRLVLVPEGPVSCQSKAYGSVSHVNVEVEKPLSTRVHAYNVDRMTGKLSDNGSLQSKLYLCYLHSLTSFCLADPLTRSTGTEQALSILDSAAIKSIVQLAPSNIELLGLLGYLTPGRSYYPTNERVMQSIDWSMHVGFMARHGSFHKSVQSIYDQAETYSIFQPESCIERRHQRTVDLHLLERDCIRSSTFRVSGSGAEEHTVKHDQIYTSRDQNQDSEQEHKAFAMAYIIAHRRRYLHKPVRQRLADHLLAILSEARTVYGPSRPLPLSDIRYDGLLLQNHMVFLAQHWMPLHHALRGARSSIDEFRLMIWLSTLGYSTNADMEALQAVASFYTTPEVGLISAPPIISFQLDAGTDVKPDELLKIFRPALFVLTRCPEGTLKKKPYEKNNQFVNRRQSEFQRNQDKALNALATALKEQWPCEVPTMPGQEQRKTIDAYMNVEQAVQLAKPRFKVWFENRRYLKYLEDISTVLSVQSVKPVPRPSYVKKVPTPSLQSEQYQRFVSTDTIFSCSAPQLPQLNKTSITGLVAHYPEAKLEVPLLNILLESLEQSTTSNYEENYAKALRGSLGSLQGFENRLHLQLDRGVRKARLSDYLISCRVHVQQVFDAIICCLASSNNSISMSLAIEVNQWPRLSPIFLLRQLNRKRWSGIPSRWQECIIQYGLAFTELHRAERLLSYADNEMELIRELQNAGHTNWSPFEYPESLLLEVESGIMIREVQEQIAGHMRKPASGANSVMQLNMGEGKSSVIVPIVAAALADGSCLVRVIVAKPQSKQMLQMLVSKLGGLLDRQVYHMPFSRALKLHPEDGKAEAMGKIYRDCTQNGGILLVQPEHLLSFKLMVLECFIADKALIGRSLLRMQEFFDRSSRDLVDESDENFSVKFELVYTMGSQRPIEFSPERWLCIFTVLDMVRQFAFEVKNEFPQSLDVDQRQPGSFPRIRFLRPDAEREIIGRIAQHICEATGMNGLPIVRRSKPDRQAVYRYLTEANLSPEEIALVEGPGGFWTSSTCNALLLLRGLFACGILSFAFGQKRWRVNYGLDVTRKPGTKLAVPYRAKDNPTARSEFSHPDVVIVLTSLTHYYGGLQDDDLSMAFAHLLRSDQADIEYGVWVRDAPSLPHSFKTLSGINLKDRIQCEEQVYPSLRYSKGAIDYFLARIVFPKEMKEFPHKLSASGWDIGKTRPPGLPLTGFSGTNDSQMVLPLTVGHLDLPEQEHTNALVLKYLLQDENSVALMKPRFDASISDARALLAMVIAMPEKVQVILDVGAQILELDNLEVAKEWLKMMSNDEDAQAVIFCDDNDELCVLDRHNNIEALQTSSFATQMDVCLVYLDESHTRGTDLRLPTTYRAAVTMGPNLTKDRLVQACMRMRKLGKGQSVVFCVPEEIKARILARASKLSDASIDVSDVLSWAISETFVDTRKSIPLWAAQGQRFEQQSELWAATCTQDGFVMSQSQAESFLEDEMQSLDHRYRPRVRANSVSLMQPSSNQNLNKIAERCKELNNLNFVSATLQEEQERELAPEIEQERQTQKAAPAEPADHKLHADLMKFVSAGVPVPNSKAYIPAFSSLRTTSAAKGFDVSQFPNDLLVTEDFSKTIQVSSYSTYISDSFQRPVRWVLTSTGPLGGTTIKHMLIISPFEANLIEPQISGSKMITLHPYAPRLTLGFLPMDRLDSSTCPSRSPSLIVPRKFVVLLNLFAGQLYFSSFEEYTEVCDLLGLAWEKSENGSSVAPDGFILKSGNSSRQSTFKQSPTMFLQVLMTKVRNHCESIEKTHMGKMLNGTLLTRADFEKLEDGLA
ncbi:uncharacterized protein LY89DRAFT_637548 [Mollisia scopiformis]|uniref:ubiquitinyl hydrolase 1 n=1 Tax=Mollisia scopiformis TaxID=149040 RepID=A0A194XNE4_MOLSC|nr:uncharacterized protein LY89DRAFT_637548 [Mollisia scopiformis]KUJ21678.1 hypothetical protein LY89DRAFT_637548 [Mollisia scopiformis]